MAQYCYIAKDGAKLEITCPMGKAPKRIRRNKRTYLRDYYAEIAGHQSGDIWTDYASEAMGCGKNQIDDYNRAAARDGIRARWDENGLCRPEGRSGRNQVMRWLGNKDLDGGYGDYTGGNRPVETFPDIPIKREGY